MLIGARCRAACAGAGWGLGTVGVGAGVGGQRAELARRRGCEEGACRVSGTRVCGAVESTAVSICAEVRRLIRSSVETRRFGC